MANLVWSNDVDNILRIGHSLSSIGHNNWALSKVEALRALSQIEKLKIPILGGDVYILIDGIFQSIHDNWYSEPTPLESDSEYILRSISEAKKYIETYKINYSNEIFFTLVPGLGNITSYRFRQSL